MIAREKELQAKKEGKTSDIKFSKATSSSRQWSTFRDPRIVRVSRHFGGKDRHSKVCTIRGLRDRRIRLSVPTAIQVYDLQNKLGLSQPSKVIDWLLDASKQDIDLLPPLPVIPQAFSQFHQQMHSNTSFGLASQSLVPPFFDVNSTFMKDEGNTSLLSNNDSVKINHNVGEFHSNMMPRSRYWSIEDLSREKHKDVATNHDVKGKWINSVAEENQEGSSSVGGQVSAQNLFPLSHPSLLNGAAMSHNSHSQWEPSSLSLSPFACQGIESNNNTPNPHAGNELRFQNSLGGSQIFFCPSAAALPNVLHNPSYITNPVESNTRQLDHLQLFSSSSQHLPFSLDVNSRLMQSQNNNESRPFRDSTDS